MRGHDKRSLGSTGVQLTQLGFGGGALGELWSPIPDEQARQTVEVSVRSGITYYDTAPWYGRGLSERRLGNTLRHQNRNGFVISTKVGRVLSAPPNPDQFDRAPWKGGLPFAHVHDYTYDGLLRSYEDSLQRLALNRVDLLIIHDLDHWHFHTDEAVGLHMKQLQDSGYRALEELKRDGRVRAIGAGINQARTITQFLDAVPLDFFLVALCYTLLDQSALPGMERAAALGMGFIAGAVFNSGILATGAVEGAKYNYADAPAEVLERTRRIERIARAHGVPLATAALQFPLGHPKVASVIPGALAPAQVSSNIASIEYPIPAEFWSELQSAGLLARDVPVPAS